MDILGGCSSVDSVLTDFLLHTALCGSNTGAGLGLRQYCLQWGAVQWVYAGGWCRTRPQAVLPAVGCCTVGLCWWLGVRQQWVTGYKLGPAVLRY